MNLKRWDRKIAFVLIIIVAAVIISAPLYIFAKKHIAKNHTAIEQAVNSVQNATGQPIEVIPPSGEQQQAIVQNPPKHAAPATAPATVTNNPDGTKTTQVAESSPNLPATCKTTKTSSGGSTPASVFFTDNTEQNAILEQPLKNFLASTLRWGGEISSLYEIVVCNGGDTGWEGQYLGSYVQSSSGSIVSSHGFIVLNTYYHQSDPRFTDYMKLVLSHEYGHHYSLYHKWVDLQLPSGTRFPDDYYNIRPLSKANTAIDYSLGWDHCEAEIVAEDYSYLYSGYGFQAMSATFGYPSAGIKNWFNSLTASTAIPTTDQSSTLEPTNSTPAPESPSAPAEAPAETTPAPDTEIPTVTITQPNSNPYLWNDNKNLYISIVGQDNVGVIKIKIYINGVPAGEIDAANATATWKNANADPGSYEIKVEAHDAAGNMGTATLTVIKS